MAKADEAAEDQPKRNRHVNVALNNIRKRGDALTAKINELTAERDGIDAAIKALE